MITEQATVFKAALAGQGKPAPIDFSVLRDIVVAPNRETSIRDVGPAIAESYRIFGTWRLFTDVVGDAKTHPEFEELIADRFIIGSPEECAAQIQRALTMPEAEQRERMANLRMTVREFNVYRWAGRMLTDAGRLRLHARIEARVQRHHDA